MLESIIWKIKKRLGQGQMEERDIIWIAHMILEKLIQVEVSNYMNEFM